MKRHGGARKGAGRKPKGKKAGVPHRARPILHNRYPVHVTIRMHAAITRLRRPGPFFRRLRNALSAAQDRNGMRICHYSVQHNHIHLIVEAHATQALSRGMQGLGIRLARRINALLDRKGAVLSDRYHGHILRTPLEVKRALQYVLCNAKKHGHAVRNQLLDPFSSACWFDGFTEGLPRELVEPTGPPDVAAPRTWLLGVGWKDRYGKFSVHDRPASA